jgi:cation diffusion facilitator CzcD-associated flavoprotein CzcO
VGAFAEMVVIVSDLKSSWKIKGANANLSYSSASEILAYFKNVVDEHGLTKYFKLSHRVVGAYWNEDEKNWRVKVQRGDNPYDVFEDIADVFVNASGVLNKWKWPAIKGRETFQGEMLHSANWDDSIKLEGQRVGVIGSGSSAVQIVPNIQPSKSQFSRTSFEWSHS